MEFNLGIPNGQDIVYTFSGPLPKVGSELREGKCWKRKRAKPKEKLLINLEPTILFSRVLKTKRKKNADPLSPVNNIQPQPSRFLNPSNY